MNEYKKSLDEMYEAFMSRTAGKRDEFMKMVDSPRKIELSKLFNQLDNLKAMEVKDPQSNSLKIEIERIEKNIKEF